MNERFEHYRLGIPKIDAEHFKLIEMMEAAKACSKDNDLTALSKQIFDIQIELEFHLVHEEMYMEKIDYPYTEYHKDTHNDLRKELSCIMSKYKQDVHHFTAHANLIECLEKVIIYHIDFQDRQIAEYVNKQCLGDRGTSSFAAIIEMLS